VASCSYHLNILGKYGYLEQISGPGRERPWRVTSSRQDLSAPGPELEDELASQAAIEAFVEQEFDRLRSWRRRLQAEPGEWQSASGLGGSTIWVTAEELQQMKDELLAVLGQYTDRGDKPTLRPDGSRAARVFYFTAVSPPR